MINLTKFIIVVYLKFLPFQLYCVWLDNLFISKNLMICFIKNDFAIASITIIKFGILK